MSILRSTRRKYLLPFAACSLALPVAMSYGIRGDDNEARETAQQNLVTVLYEGPLVHDQNWTINAGPAGPDNQKYHGTCSTVPSDVHNVSAVERVSFDAKSLGLGLWSMGWVDSISGIATDGNNYYEYMRFDFIGRTNDGKAPRPNRASPSAQNEGFLQTVPSNVDADALDLNDDFVLHSRTGDIVANSHVHWTFRLQIPPVSMDPPPAFFPFLLGGKYILNIHDQLAGQLGCDSL